jgi:glycosyltransferase involved in cell wall biosynthesis
MRNKPKLSIVTTSFNQGHFIERTILSILSQTYSSIEFIVVDGASTDSTLAILDRYKDYIDLIISEPDCGPADALNKGFTRASGDYLAFLNSDDVYDPIFAEVLIAEIVARQVDLIYSDVRFIDKSDAIFTPYNFPFAFAVHVSPKRFLASACIIPQQGAIWTRRLHDYGLKFNTENKTCWDLEFFVDALCAGFKFHPLPRCLSSFRLHDTSITGESLFNDEGSVNSRATYRSIDHARIRSKLLDFGFNVNRIESSLLKADNLARRTFRLLTRNES